MSDNNGFWDSVLHSNEVMYWANAVNCIVIFNLNDREWLPIDC